MESISKTNPSGGDSFFDFLLNLTLYALETKETKDEFK